MHSEKTKETFFFKGGLSRVEQITSFKKTERQWLEAQICFIFQHKDRK